MLDELRKHRAARVHPAFLPLPPQSPSSVFRLGNFKSFPAEKLPIPLGISCLRQLHAIFRDSQCIGIRGSAMFRLSQSSTQDVLFRAAACTAGANLLSTMTAGTLRTPYCFATCSGSEGSFSQPFDLGSRKKTKELGDLKVVLSACWSAQNRYPEREFRDAEYARCYQACG